MNRNISDTSFVRIAILGVMLVSVCAPTEIFAAAPKPTCFLEISSGGATTTIQGEGDVFIRKGDVMEIAWESTYAKKALDGKGRNILLSDTKTILPKRSGAYSFHFSSGSKKVTCRANVRIITGSIMLSTLASTASKPSISGRVSGTKTIQIEISKEGSSKVLYTSKIIRVKNGSWKTKITKTLADGTYDVRVFGDMNIALNTVATGTLVIGKAVDSDEKVLGMLVAESVPLLSGGVAHAGESVAISYVQVINIGKEPVTLEGFWLKQNGSAREESVIGLTTVDDTEDAYGSVGGVEDSHIFKNGSALAPISVIFAPGQMRLFTIKAMLARDTSVYSGTQLKIDIEALYTKASVKSGFPICGTTWTIAH